jgi:Bacterial TSP3 repeat
LFSSRHFCAVAAGAQMVDLNGNGMSDVWEWFYSATNLTSNADANGDGFSNLSAALAGVSPFDSNAVPKISPLVFSPTNANITMAGQLGKLYQLQSNTNLGSGNWLTETSMVLRAGTNFTFPSPIGATMKFYRILISDVDSDGDGLSDWEEYKLGTDPSNAWSNASLDGNGIALTDYQYATNLLAQQNVLSLVASDPATTQPDPGTAPTDLGTFTISRGGFALNAITVNLFAAAPALALQRPVWITVTTFRHPSHSRRA